MHSKDIAMYFTAIVPSKNTSEPIITPTLDVTDKFCGNAVDNDIANGENCPKMNGFVSNNPPMNDNSIFNVGLNCRRLVAVGFLSEMNSLTFVISIFLLSSQTIFSLIL